MEKSQMDELALQMAESFKQKRPDLHQAALLAKQVYLILEKQMNEEILDFEKSLKEKQDNLKNVLDFYLPKDFEQIAEETSKETFYEIESNATIVD